MQIVHDSSGKKKPMQVVDDGKEIKLKKFDKLDIPEPDFPEVLGLDVSHSIRDGYDWFYDYFNYK